MSNMRMKLAVVFLGGALALGASTPLDEGYRHLYNLDFQAAHLSFDAWIQAHPEDPMGPVSTAAAYLFTELDRMQILQSELFVDNVAFLRGSHQKPDPVLKKKLYDAVERSRVLADRILQRSPEDPGAMFATILRHGLVCDYLALVEKRYLAAFGQMKQGRTLAERLLKAHPEYADAHLAIGVESYMLSLKPAPVRWLLRIGGARTDRQEGLAKLRITAEKGRFLLPYARLLLAVAALRERNRGHARQQLAWLAGEFPHNRLYREELAKLQ